VNAKQSQLSLRGMEVEGYCDSAMSDEP